MHQAGDAAHDFGCLCGACTCRCRGLDHTSRSLPRSQEHFRDFGLPSDDVLLRPFVASMSSM
jgi:hypothetical protein